jgi:hypothetical protein
VDQTAIEEESRAQPLACEHDYQVVDTSTDAAPAFTQSGKVGVVLQEYRPVISTAQDLAYIGFGHAGQVDLGRTNVAGRLHVGRDPDCCRKDGGPIGPGRPQHRANGSARLREPLPRGRGLVSKRNRYVADVVAPHIPKHH